MRKFGAPETCIHSYSHWSALLRPAQVTLGSLVLVAHEPVRAFAELSRDSYIELKTVTEDVENGLKSAFSFDKLNYLMLMMVDPDVHFHVIPRYADERIFQGRAFSDRDWPGPPDLTKALDMADTDKSMLRDFLRENWNL